MTFEIGDEVVGVDPAHAATFGRVCKVIDCRWSEGGEVRRHVVDLIVYDPDTKIWEDYDTTLVNVPVLALKVESPYFNQEKLDDAVGGVLNSQDPFAAVEVLMFRNWLQDRIYAGGDSVAECQFISCEELIRQAAECLVRLSSAAMKPYEEEVSMSKKSNRNRDPDGEGTGCAAKGLQGDKADVGAHHGAQQSKPAAPVSNDPRLPEAFWGRPQEWKDGFLTRLDMGNITHKEKEAADLVATHDPLGTSQWGEGWNKASNYLRSGGK